MRALILLLLLGLSTGKPFIANWDLFISMTILYNNEVLQPIQRN